MTFHFLAAALSLGLAGSMFVAQDADSASALAQARQLINQGKPQAAIEKLTTFAEPRRPEVTHLLGVAYYHADDYPRAIQQLLHLLALALER